MKISELSKKTGVSQRMLRYLEEVGLLNPQRTAAEYRSYSSHHVMRILEIRELQRLGLSLREIGRLMSQPDCAEGILHDVFVRERDTFLEKQRALRDLRQRFTGMKNPYFETRIAYSIPKMKNVISDLEKKGWKNSEFSYLKFNEWQDGQNEFKSKLLMIGEIIWQSSFYLIGSRDLSTKAQLNKLMADFCKAANCQWPNFNGHPPREIEQEDLGEFFAASDIIVYLSFTSKEDNTHCIVLPYQALFALAKSHNEPQC